MKNKEAIKGETCQSWCRGGSNSNDVYDMDQ